MDNEDGADPGQLLFDNTQSYSEKKADKEDIGDPGQPLDDLEREPTQKMKSIESAKLLEKDEMSARGHIEPEDFVSTQKRTSVQLPEMKSKKTFKTMVSTKTARSEHSMLFDLNQLNRNQEKVKENIIDSSRGVKEQPALEEQGKQKSKAIFHNIWRSKTTVLSYLELNLGLKQLMQKLSGSALESFDEKTANRLLQYRSSIAAISSGDFHWQNFFPEDESASNPLDTLFLGHWSKFDYMLTYSSPLQVLFPIPLIDAFVSEDLKFLPQPIMKQSLAFKASLLTVLWQYHLNHDTKHLSRIDHKNLKMLSPLIRQSIRQKNRADARITGKYFGEEWSLTKFVLRVSSLVFQAEAGEFEGTLLLQSRFLAIVLTMFDLGIFSENDVPELVNVIIRAVNMLVKRESQMCASPLEIQSTGEPVSDDSDSSDDSSDDDDDDIGSSDLNCPAVPADDDGQEENDDSSSKETANHPPNPVTKDSIYELSFEQLYNLQKCKQQIVSILSHIVILNNDLALLSLLPWRNYPHLVEQFGLRSIMKRQAGLQRNFLFESKTLCNQIILIASKAFFQSPAYSLFTTELERNNFLHKIKDQEPMITKFVYTSKCLRIYSQDLIESITNPQEDALIASSRIMDDTLFEYITSKEKLAASRVLSTQVSNFTSRLVTKFEEGLVTNFDSDENYSIELRILLEEIQDFVKVNSKNLGVSVTFALENAHSVLLTIAYMTEALSREKKKYVDSRCCDLALAILGDISGDAISQGFLFTDFNWDLFQEMLTQRPHLLALILSRAFKNVSKELNISYKEQLLEKLLPLFERLIVRSTDMIKEEFSYLYKDIDKCPDGVISGDLEESANRLLLYLISVHSFSKTILGLNRNRGKSEEDFFNVDLRLQLILRKCYFPLFFQQILKKGSEFLQKKPYQGYIPRFDFEKYAFEGFDYAQGITHDKLRGAIFSIGWSLTELMAKITSRIYLAEDERSAVNAIDLTEIYDTFSYLASVDNGIQLKAILLKFMSNFTIFRASNTFTTSFDTRYLTDPRDSLQIFFGWDYGTIYYGRDYVAEYLPKEILDNFVQEFGFLGKLRGQGSLRTQEGGLKDSIKIYLFKGLFPSIYKFCQGFLGLLTISNYDIANSKTLISGFLEDLLPFTIKLIEFQKNVTQTLGIPLISGKVDGLIEFIHTAQRFAKSDNSKTDPLSDQVHKKLNEIDPMKFEELDEKLSPELAEVRSLLRRICRMIEESCPQEFMPYIDSFLRRNALKRKMNKLDGVFKSKLSRNNGATQNDSQDTVKVDIEADLEKLRQHMNTLRRGYGSLQPLEHFKLACEVYQLRKSIWLKEDSNSNSFFKFLDEHPQDTARYVQFTLVSLQENLFEFVRRDLNIKRQFKLKSINIESMAPAMIVSRHQHTLLAQMEQLCSQTDRGRKILFRIVGESMRYGSLIIALVRSIVEILRFNYLKTFHDMTYHQMNRLADKLGAILDTFAEGGDKNFRKCISNYEYSQQIAGSYRPLIIDLVMYFDRMLMVSECAHLKQVKFMTMAEKPENFHIISKLVNIILSCLSGPDVEGQSHIYNLAGDKLSMIFERIVHDINSPFYNLKLQIVNYYSMLLEEAHIENEAQMVQDNVTGKSLSVREMNKKIINNTIGSIRYNLIENQIVACLKKLYVSRIFKTKPWFKAKLIEKLKQDFERQKQELIESKNKLAAAALDAQSLNNPGAADTDFFQLGNIRQTELDKRIFELDMKIDKLGYLELYKMDFEDRDAIIFPEFENAVKLPHYEELKSLYIKDPEFSEHMIIKLCMRLQGMLYSIARNSDQMNILNKERISEMYSYYGRNLPEHLQEMIDTSECKRLKPSDATERVNIFMFLSQITQNIELTLSSAEGPLTKLIDFKLPAQSFFLSNQTRKNFFFKTDPEEMVSKAVETFPKFLIEMKRNYHFYNRSKLLYTVSASDLVTGYKIGIWYLCFAMNVVLVCTARTDTDGQRIFVGVGRTFFVVFSLAIAALCVAVLALWSQGKYPELVQCATLKYKRHFAKPKPPLALRFRVYVWETILTKRTPFQMIFTIVFCLLGAFANEFFLTLNLLMLMFISNTASYIARSITTHARQLGLTFVMALFVMYIFSFIAYTNYSKSWNKLVDNSGTIEMCTDLWECTIYSVIFGFLNGGGLGDSLSTPVSHGQTGSFLGRFFFDILFFIMISVIALNVAFGIIIDTFASMRDAQARRMSLLKTTCVVCKKTKAELEQSGESAKMHISSKHSIWNYVNYMLYLNLTEKSKFNSIENAVYESLRENSVDWIPSQMNQLIHDNKVMSVNLRQKMDELVTRLQTKKSTFTSRMEESQSWVKKIGQRIFDKKATDKIVLNLGFFTEKLPDEAVAEPAAKATEQGPTQTAPELTTGV